MTSNKKRSAILIKPKIRVLGTSLITRRYGLLVSLFGVLGIFTIIFIANFIRVDAPHPPNTPQIVTVFQPEHSSDTASSTPIPRTTIATTTRKPSPTQTTQPTPLSKCPGADWLPQASIAIGDNVRVCTKKDRLIVRKKPKQSANEIIAIYPGSIVEIKQGPYCADTSWWWKVTVPVNTKYANSSYASYSSFHYLSQSVTGYVREGTDSIDKYFICP